MPQKKSYHHGDLLQSLIDAALDLIAEKDVTDVSLREIARRVGVSHTAPYRHFADKEALLAAVAQEGFLRFRQSIEEAMEPVVDPLERLEAGCFSYLRYAAKHPSRYRIMFGMQGISEGKNNSAIAALARDIYSPFTIAIGEGQSAGVIRNGDPQQIAQTVWALMHGLTMLRMHGQLERGEDEAIASLHLLVKPSQ
ncbi:MAG: TetR/AcrR family transcriptional regulator [Cyanobacteriota bacterium]|nr:TetR/AcrR family transcriptional regulator [Cyanobacteriota bacterium]